MTAEIVEFVKTALGHEPSDAGLFERAFTHSSLARESYERLEFLGDRVLGLVIATALYERYPNEPEGQLSRRYNVLVARENCGEIGRSLGVPALIRLGRQARDDSANHGDNLVGDVIESLIGALMIDADIETARRFILKAWGPLLDNQGRAPQHPKSQLQEIAASRGLKTPEYALVSRIGAHHAPRFTVTVSVPRLGEATAEGNSKQEAEKAAASALLEQLQ
ncbi:MAG: ribonuclease III [Sphingomonas sp.]|nr:ribonuclease III [Sphingomonas sp.]